MTERQDLCADHHKWKAELEEKSRRSLEFAVHVLKRAPQIVSELAPTQVQRTFAGIIDGQRKHPDSDLFELAKRSAKLFGMFEPEECPIVAQAIVDELPSNVKLRDFLNSEVYADK